MGKPVKIEGEAGVVFVFTAWRWMPGGLCTARWGMEEESQMWTDMLIQTESLQRYSEGENSPHFLSLFFWLTANL